jgi:hypothetical protein
MLAPNPGYAAFFSWITGWFNFLGQGQSKTIHVLQMVLTVLEVAVTTGITFGCAGLISTLATVKSSFEPSAGKTVGIHAGII